MRSHSEPDDAIATGAAATAGGVRATVTDGAAGVAGDGVTGSGDGVEAVVAVGVDGTGVTGTGVEPCFFMSCLPARSRSFTNTAMRTKPTKPATTYT